MAKVLLLALAITAAAWDAHAPLPEARTEVAGAALGGEIVVLGGLLESGGPSARVDAYRPAKDTWRRLPNLPAALHHTMVASDGSRLYVAGGYGVGFRSFRPQALVYERGAWRSLPRMPAPRAAGGAAVVGRHLYVVGGVGPEGLARDMYVLDLVTRKWTIARGPKPREHLAVTSFGGRIYALAGRTAGLDTNLSTLEVYTPSTGRWRTLARVPQARGGTAAAALGGRIVSVGGEAPGGTTERVYVYDIGRNRWSRSEDLSTPRHGLAVVAHGGRVYAIGGGPDPGLTVSDANESLRVP